MRVPILAYHSLDDSGSVVSVAPRVFAEQMRSLRDDGFGCISLATLLDAWNGSRPLPIRPIVLTFDDGYRNFLDHAASVLAELGFGATLFVIADRLGSDNAWPGQSRRVPRLPLLAATELREIAESGFEVGSHGMTHARLDRLPSDMLAGEIAGARHRLEDALGRPVPHFAYPYGAISPAARDAIRRVHAASCGTRLRVASPTDSRHELPRIEMHYLRTAARLRMLPTILGRCYMTVRAVGRGVRALLPEALA